MNEVNENVQSQLSAFVDDQLPQDETELLARRLSRDNELQQSMSRYLLIGEAIRSPSQARLSRDFSSRVAAAIEQDSVKDDEPTATTSVRTKNRLWLRPVMGMSLAASVAALTVITVHNLQTPGASNSVTQLATNGAASSIMASPSNSDVVPVATNSPSVPISAARLTNYVVAHSEFTSPLGHRNTMTGLVTGDQQTDTEETVEDASPTK